MPEELSTRDVFQQVDSRLTRVEDDLRAFRKEVLERFDRLEGEMHATFRWVIGLILVSWLSLMVSFWLK